MKSYKLELEITTNGEDFDSRIKIFLETVEIKEIDLKRKIKDD